MLDGRNRLRACELASVEPEFTEFGGTDPVAFVVSCNVQRRHLNSSQRAMAAQDTLPMLEAEAKERQGRRGDLTSSNYLLDVPEGQARDRAARLFSTNRQYVSDAKVIAAARPDLAEQVRSGDLTIPQVMREIRRAERTEEIVFKGNIRREGLDSYEASAQRMKEIRVIEAELAEEVSRHDDEKVSGRPKGGNSETARRLGVGEATVRRAPLRASPGAMYSDRRVRSECADGPLPRVLLGRGPSGERWRVRG